MKAVKQVEVEAPVYIGDVVLTDADMQNTIRIFRYRQRTSDRATNTCQLCLLSTLFFHSNSLLFPFIPALPRNGSQRILWQEKRLPGYCSEMQRRRALYGSVFDTPCIYAGGTGHPLPGGDIR